MIRVSPWLRLLLLCALVYGCSKKTPASNDPEDVEPPPPQWYFQQVQHDLTEVTLTDIWGRSDGTVFAVGWFGTIITNRKDDPDDPSGVWLTMPTPTQAHLTGIYGVENGQLFGLDAAEGEMFAVGWEGTLLHYHPNPDDNPDTHDGTWSLIAGPEGDALVPIEKVDPACPDFDGDGISDDGDGTGWSGDNICAAGGYTNCDDNCRTSPNGDQRPVVDLNSDFCIGPGDGGDPDSARWQRDADGDGLGEVCDDNEGEAAPVARFDATLFDVWVDRSGQDLFVIAVGGDGAVVTFQGPSAGVDPLPPATLAVTDPLAWTAQTSMAFYFDNDCYGTGAPAGDVCTGSGRLPPSCPAMCSPRTTNCSCPVDQFQCCDAGGGLTGAGCSDTTCPPAQNACAGTGDCRALCPDCFRRMNQTLRAVYGTGDALVVVGAQGTVGIGDPADPTGVWRHPECRPLPSPMDDRPTLAAVSGQGSSFMFVGSSGTAVRLAVGGGGCEFEPRDPDSAAFLSGAYSTGGDRAWVVGDGGYLAELNGNGVEILDPEVDENLLAVWLTVLPGNDRRLWLVGASGMMVQGEYY